MNPLSYETKYFVQKELDIRGSRNALGDFTDVIGMLEQGKFNLGSMITEVFPFEKAGQALEKWDRNPAAVTRFLIACQS